MIHYNLQYEQLKNDANEFMQKGEISKYFEALVKMNRYKNLMLAIMAN